MMEYMTENRFNCEMCGRSIIVDKIKYLNYVNGKIVCHICYMVNEAGVKRKQIEKDIEKYTLEIKELRMQQKKITNRLNQLVHVFYLWIVDAP